MSLNGATSNRNTPNNERDAHPAYHERQVVNVQPARLDDLQPNMLKQLTKMTITQTCMDVLPSPQRVLLNYLKRLFHFMALGNASVSVEPFRAASAAPTRSSQSISARSVWSRSSDGS
ncbi:unnamed protein product [Penicillium pancosmium]